MTRLDRRQCGPCTVCCTELKIFAPELKKEARVPCPHLGAKGCGIYDTRPQICRSYSTDNCDYHGGDYNYDHLFTSADDLCKFGAAEIDCGLRLRAGESTRPVPHSRSHSRIKLARPHQSGSPPRWLQPPARFSFEISA